MGLQVTAIAELALGLPGAQQALDAYAKGLRRDAFEQVHHTSTGLRQVTAELTLLVTTTQWNDLRLTPNAVAGLKVILGLEYDGDLIEWLLANKAERWEWDDRVNYLIKLPPVT